MIKWVGRLAFLTGLLGLIGTLIIILNINKNKGSNATAENHQKQELPVKISKPATDTPAAIPPAQPDSTALAFEHDTTQKLDTSVEKPQNTITKTQTPLAKNSELPNNPKDVEVKQPKVSAVQPPSDKPMAGSSKPKAVLKKEKKEVLFNKDELRLISNRLFMAKIRNLQRIDCVQINVTASGNNRKKAAQMYRYLKRHGFTIAGREVIDEDFRGFKIYPIHSCLKLVLGSF